MEEKTTFGRFIAKKRKETNLTQKELAAQIYVTESAVSKWERGLSYPDISIVTSICDALKITEHELITASDDFRQRGMEKQVKSYRNFVIACKWICIALYGITALTCFICNLAIQHTLSWFFIVLTAELTAFSLTTLPLLIVKNRAISALGGFFISLNLLLATCAIYSGGNWFFITFFSLLFAFSVIFLPFILRVISLPVEVSSHRTLISFIADSLLLFVLLFVCFLQTGNIFGFFTIACPSALFSLTYPWAIMIIIRYTKINALFKTSACFFVTGIFCYFSLSFFRLVARENPFDLYQINFINWSEPYITGNILLILLLSCMVISAVFAGGGIALELKRKR